MPRNSNQIKKHIVLRRSDRNLAPAQKSTTLVAKGVEKTFVLSALWRTSIPVANFVRRRTNSDIPRPKSPGGTLLLDVWFGFGEPSMQRMELVCIRLVLTA